MLSRGGGDDANEFPNGSCEGQHENTPDLDTGCGWITGDEASYYIMPGADLSYANLNRANLMAANLSRANLEDTSFGYADLSGADLTDADLTDANLRGANLNRANLIGANLRDASLSGVKADSRTTCPNREKWGTRRHDCGF